MVIQRKTQDNALNREYHAQRETNSMAKVSEIRRNNYRQTAEFPETCPGDSSRNEGSLNQTKFHQVYSYTNAKISIKSMETHQQMQ